MLGRAQRTLKRKVCYSGVGVHFGKPAMLTLEPAEENTGVVFSRHAASGQYIPARLANVCGTGRSTTLSSQGGVVSTVEHLLAALYSCGVDNVRIHCSEDEIPIGDGSSQVFVDLIDQAGVEEQGQTVPIARLTHPVYYQHQDTILAAFPSEEFKISYTLHYSHNSAIGTQYRSQVISEESFRKEIAPCRTFALYNELCFLMERGLIGGGCLGNAVLFKDDSVISLGKLRFPDEPVRHKMLDLIGDLSLIGKPFLAHIIAVGSGHSSNIALGNKILEALQYEQELVK
ncbi:UDP-3-O-[3-hydroxymyristoyl] N-acetylglucosamine deacetylase [Chlamydia muridarum str. Nigg]|uniref:UDP-3-O-acyl-N-acetylglucosamine deacetylase n=2 Tax=Chlamydia muridarum TaxID=83560 RepID=LPXC_CHLMU|nr:UDP-3-O-acyl-N-acetylglucosamine deacetylase [Chlamydia muridarum]Q9PJK9.2 RecName: Full=UDP-3-O-acyl-N-acetylglucosamine deacetylase; Short=UDP-3-O-acyl-GlcNAc deacetylase; AltName: Full=UDP-3-O-[R-3-hydroxymyristoyl]-N-acetylglucosamine deacetylase [Chlamydia muridarum str. Nigg]UFX24822.1 UDP-3-O-acyl-N-acetylglucosamine deacetylase [Chlamydia trachomatis]AHH23206.1 UDP-3-O-(3-hydroxymyristoyl) glucosamine N-acyltransferase [Chlamydia muridarum str. Nigg3 CMUT3-5]AHH24132.1 UDP-3-O-(3-hyd